MSAATAPARSPGRDLRRKLRLVIAPFADAGERLIAHPRVRDLYPEYLFTSHCVIRARQSRLVGLCRRLTKSRVVNCAPEDFKLR